MNRVDLQLLMNIIFDMSVSVDRLRNRRNNLFAFLWYGGSLRERVMRCYVKKYSQFFLMSLFNVFEPGTDLALRFSDQFRPLQVSSSLSWARSDSTIMRFPLRSEEQAADTKFKDGEECRDTDIASILDNFRNRASSALLFLKTVEDVSFLNTLELDLALQMILILERSFMPYVRFLDSNV